MGSATVQTIQKPYRGRLAPSPTGYLHLGHALTFWTAFERTTANAGKLILRIEDLDRERCRAEFRDAIAEDLKWFGMRWDEGPVCGGAFAPYVQSERRAHYLSAWKKLRDGGFIYPCSCSRRDVLQSLAAPHEHLPGSRTPIDDEPLYPGTCRPAEAVVPDANQPSGTTWRFRVPHGEKFSFTDARLGLQSAVAGADFGDFVVWRKDDIPAYQLAVTVDDAAMQITEVVRGEDLLTSTFRQLLLYRALGMESPAFFHCPLVTDENSQRLAKRHESLSLRALRENGADPEKLRTANPSSAGRSRSR